MRYSASEKFEIIVPLVERPISGSRSAPVSDGSRATTVPPVRAEFVFAAVIAT